MSDFSEPSPSDGGRRTGWAELATGETVELARIGARFGARVLDAIIVAVIDFVIVIALVLGSLEDLEDDPDGAIFGVGIFLLLFAVGITYEVVQTALWGKTLGKRMVGIKVVNAAHGDIPGFGKALGRWAVPSLPSVIFLLIPALTLIAWLWAALCYLSLTWDRVSQGWHDKAAGTLVIRT